MDLQEGHARDLLIAAVVVGGILLSLFLYTGNWPPPVVIESNSMMHVDADEYEDNFGTTRAEDVPYGRIGTIDPGDLVLVKQIDGPEAVETFADAGEEHYGMPGEVIVYYPFGNEGVTPIIHRAMTYVDRSVASDGDPTYTVRWSPEWPEQGRCQGPPEDRTCTFGSDGVTIPALGLRHRHFEHSGFITKGDNKVGNPNADQAIGIISEPVRAQWVQGVARGELPWFGLIKLTLTQPAKNVDVADHPYFLTFGNMTAPKDLWVMLVVALGAVAVLPVGIEYGLQHLYRLRNGDEGAPPTSAPQGGSTEAPDEPAGPWAPEPPDEGSQRVDIDLE